MLYVARARGGAAAGKAIDKAIWDGGEDCILWVADVGSQLKMKL